jgi:hypothetical protein
MGNTKFVEALVAGGGGVAGDGVGDSGVDQGRDEGGMAASGFGDEDEGRRSCRRIRILQSGIWPLGCLSLIRRLPKWPAMLAGVRCFRAALKTSRHDPHTSGRPMTADRSSVPTVSDLHGLLKTN